MAKAKQEGLTKEDLLALPEGATVVDRDGDVYIKFVTEQGDTSWIDPDVGESIYTILGYGPLEFGSLPIPPTAPATNERLIEVAQRVVDAYFFGDANAGRDLIDALTTLQIELSTLKETP